MENLEFNNNGISYSYENLTIQLLDEPTYTVGNDNERAYSLEHFTDGPQDSNGSFHGIRIFKDEVELNSCLIIGSGGTTVHATSAVVDRNSLLVCCGDSVFSLDLTSLGLNWQTHADLVACFQIHIIENEYLVHGEVEVSRLNTLGEVVWSFSGCDIFVSAGDQEAMEIHNDRIILVDWEANKYELDFNGKVIDKSLSES